MCGSLFVCKGAAARRRGEPVFTGGGGRRAHGEGDCRRLAAETRGDRKPCLVSCPLLPLSVGTDTPGRRRRPLSTLTSSVNLASSGEPLYRRKVCRLLTVKKKGAHRLRRAEVSRQLKKRLYSGRGLWYADNKCLQDFVGTDDRSAGLHHILSHYVEKRQMNVRSVFAALYTA